ncbi:unnamed protein product [Rotaria magnacalcarata]|uniref:Uncharacterized protein n=1 Tax=Rotaria magnacalcarata TaxID=392030 RepID=A0A8S2QJI9_9BILA|nr:unnamed protein product [Rotaria magnacalcarata]
MEGPNGNITIVLRYLLPNATCRLHPTLKTANINQQAIELSCIKLIGRSYMITNDTQLIETNLAYEPQWCTTKNILNLKTLTEEIICALECKLLEISQPQSYVITSGYKRTQKLRKEAIVADKTATIVLNIYDMHFNSIELGQSYKITAVKTRLFKDVISLSTTTETIFNNIPELLDVSFDNSLVFASLKKIDGLLNDLQPDICNTNNITAINSYKVIIQISTTEEYSLILPRNLLVQCLTMEQDSSDISEIMLFGLIKNKNFIPSHIECIFDLNSGIINQIESKHYENINDIKDVKLDLHLINSPSIFNKDNIPFITNKQKIQLNQFIDSKDNIIKIEPKGL